MLQDKLCFAAEIEVNANHEEVGFYSLLFVERRLVCLLWAPFPTSQLKDVINTDSPIVLL